MVFQITQGIKISVKTSFKGTTHNQGRLYYAFSYAITIENKSYKTVQLINRHWDIIDTLSPTAFVDGPGVVGQTPILAPNDHYTYTSGCYLQGNTGAMKGFYTMIDLETMEEIQVIIPTFQLTTPDLSN